MARYSDFASSDEAVLVETDDFALVYDKQNRAFRKKRWSSSTKSWSDGWRAPYSAIVCKDDSTVWAEDSSGKTIALGEAGVDDASVVQSAVTAISEGEIFMRKGTYKITQKISCPAGIFFESEGAELDLSNLNDVAFEFGSDAETADLKLTGMRNFKVSASSANSNTLLVKASQIKRGFLLEKIMHKDLNNLVEIRGMCYDATIRDCFGYDLKGVWIKLVTLDIDGVVYKPNAAEIINCELSNSWSNPSGTGIEIYSSNEDTSTSGAVGTIKIHNCCLLYTSPSPRD